MALMKPTNSIPPQSVKLLTVPDAAETLNVSRRKIWRLISTGELRSVRIGARGTRIVSDAMADFVKALPAAR